MKMWIVLVATYIIAFPGLVFAESLQAAVVEKVSAEHNAEVKSGAFANHVSENRASSRNAAGAKSQPRQAENFHHSENSHHSKANAISNASREVRHNTSPRF